jgi:tetratricopeptide (TPR) repeat protein
MSKKRVIMLGVGLFSAATGWVARADQDTVSEARRALAAKDHATAAALARDELKANPGHEEAYVVLAEAMEAQGKKEQAAEIWEQLKSITISTERLRKARHGLLRTRGPDVPIHEPGEAWDNDPYKVDIGKVDWDRLERDANGVTVQYEGKYPPVVKESPGFQVLACSERSAEVALHLCEKYTEFLLDKYFQAGQEWVLQLPIIIYKNHDDYVRVGGYPASSAGATLSDTQTGVPILIAMYMLDKDGKLDRDALEGTLPHEIVHMVIHEWFGGVDIPRWIDEGLARRMEQSRNHYEEAAKVGRDAAAGEYYRFRDLFAQKEYPQRGDRTWRFYEQSATIVLFLLEQFGPDAAVAFFEVLKSGGNHDEATAAALGIPEEGAVEEFERRWAEWARGIYVRFGDRLEDGEIAHATALDTEAFAGSFDEPGSAEKIERWSTIATDSMIPFKDIGGSHRDWSIVDGALRCKMKPQRIGSLIGIRTDDEVPLVLECKVRAPSASIDQPTLFGIAMLDHRADDTGIYVNVPLESRRPHDVRCVVTDEIALYVDGKCVGRAPALHGIDEDIDWPLAFVAHAPVEITDIRTGMIEEFLPLAKAGK